MQAFFFVLEESARRLIPSGYRNFCSWFAQKEMARFIDAFARGQAQCHCHLDFVPFASSLSRLLVIGHPVKLVCQLEIMLAASWLFVVSARARI
jgi:hypothetical protein